MWVLRAFRDAILAAVLTAARGWLALLWRPLESSRLIAALPLNLWRTWGLLGDLFGAGVIVTTPAEDGDGRGLRTAILGGGDVTTRVAGAPTLPPALVAAHFDAVRKRLVPLAATPEALHRALALGMAAMTVYLNRETKLETERWPSVAFDLLGRAFIVSFVWALLVRLAARLSRRAIQGWLGVTNPL